MIESFHYISIFCSKVIFIVLGFKIRGPLILITNSNTTLFSNEVYRDVPICYYMFDPGRARDFAGHDLGPNYLQRPGFQQTTLYGGQIWVQTIIVSSLILCFFIYLVLYFFYLFFFYLFIYSLSLIYITIILFCSLLVFLFRLYT